MKSKFLGETKGNRDVPINRSTTSGFGAPSKASMKGKFLGDTKGNRDLPINRTSGAG